MANKEYNLTDRDEMIKQIMLTLQDMGEKLRSEKHNSPKEMIPSADVLLDTMRFLTNYDENVQVLNNYWLNKKQKQKFSSKYIEELEK